MGGSNKQRPNSATQRTRKEFRQLRQRQQQQDDDRRSGAKHRPSHVHDERGVPYTTSGNNSLPWIPGSYTSFKLLLSARLSAAFWSIISDCDETYNYWEPTHFMLFGKGFQTWEYSPEFALRSYFYILIHAVPAWLYNTILQPNPMYVFYFMRCLLAVISSLCELYFFNGVTKEVGANIGRITLALMVFSAGFFSSSTAFLPSTTSMYLVMMSHGAWFHQSYALAIFFTAISTFVSWPFAALLGVPIAFDILIRKRKFQFFVKWSLISAFTILLPQTAMDTDYYGKLVSAPFNIVKYNVFTSHGPDLYGTEPWHFYFINAFLNFNIAFIACLVVIPLHFLVKFLVGLPNQSHHYIPHWLTHLALHLWLLVFGLQPHKEERFLFPIYPLICLSAATTIDLVQKLFYFLFVKVKDKHYLNHAQWISISSVGIYALLCLSRMTALYQNYHAPIDIWMHVAHMPKTQPEMAQGPVNVCIGKEWHRFPSSFFLPNNDWNLRFLKSEFRGQLPQPYDETDLKLSTKLVRPTFNDQNREELNRYVTHPASQCDFLVDLEVSDDRETVLEPTYSKDASQWSEETSVEFLDAKNSDRFFRAFYVPFLSPTHCKYFKYVLLRNINKTKRR